MSFGTDFCGGVFPLHPVNRQSYWRSLQMLSINAKFLKGSPKIHFINIRWVLFGACGGFLIFPLINLTLPFAAAGLQMTLGRTPSPLCTSYRSLITFACGAWPGPSSRGADGMEIQTWPQVQLKFTDEHDSPTKSGRSELKGENCCFSKKEANGIPFCDSSSLRCNLPMTLHNTMNFVATSLC